MICYVLEHDNIFNDAKCAVNAFIVKMVIEQPTGDSSWCSSRCCTEDTG